MGHFAGLLLAVNAGTHQPLAVPALLSQVTLWGLQRARGRAFPPALPGLTAAPPGSGGGQCPGTGGRAEPRGPAGPSGSTASPPSPVPAAAAGGAPGSGSPRPSAARAGPAGNFREVSGGKTQERTRVPPVSPALP